MSYSGKKILYIGDSSKSSTSFHRGEALSRIGNDVTILDPYAALGPLLRSSIAGRLHYRSGYRFLQNRIQGWIENEILNKPVVKPDVTWINSGELFGPRCIQLLKKLKAPVVLYNNDDPTGGRDGQRFAMLLEAIHNYDLTVVMRHQNIDEFKQRGAKRVSRVTMSYDEVAHHPIDDAKGLPNEFKSEVAFIGTWMRNEKRDEFLLHLIHAGIPVSIWGNRWEKSTHWNKLKNFYRGPALTGKEYVAAVQGAKVCLGLLSKGNRDLHTTRSLEIPYIGGVFCGQRTAEHTMMYKENEEAVFWDSPEECVQQCRKLLIDQEFRQQVQLAGMKRVRELKAGNEDVCRKILDELFHAGSKGRSADSEIPITGRGIQY